MDEIITTRQVAQGLGVSVERANSLVWSIQPPMRDGVDGQRVIDWDATRDLAFKSQPGTTPDEEHSWSLWWRRLIAAIRRLVPLDEIRAVLLRVLDRILMKPLRDLAEFSDPEHLIQSVLGSSGTGSNLKSNRPRTPA
jgi:hypothetical protein